MALTEIHKLPQNTYISAVRFLPHLSTFSRHVILSTYSTSTQTPSLQTLTLSPNISTPTLNSSLSTPSRITNLQTHPSPYSPSKPLIAGSSISTSSVLLYTADLITGSLCLENEIDGIHKGRVNGIGLGEKECVSVGEDGRVNMINVVNGGVRRVFDSCGLVNYTAVKWASPVEFVTGGFGFGMHWWDLRKNGGPVAVFKGDFGAGGRTSSGIVHSIDIHLSRKHACLAGGSSGTMFAWDTRRPQDSVVLSGVGIGSSPNYSLAESDIWEVQYDNYASSSKMGNFSSSRILPAMICSEDGILGVIEQGEEPIELLAEPCAINSFDIDKQNPSDVICSLEWESIAIVTRP